LSCSSFAALPGLLPIALPQVLGPHRPKHLHVAAARGFGYTRAAVGGLPDARF
jgi:hypothetical protein